MSQKVHFKGKKIKDRRVAALFSEDKDEVVRAVNELIKEREGTKVEKELITVLENWEEYDGHAALWSIIVLGYMGSRSAIPALLNVFDSEAGMLMEVSNEAIIHIVKSHGEEILDPIEDWIEQRLDHDPFGSRLYLYEPFSLFINSDRAKHFLIRMFEEDDKWKGFIAHGLAKFKDKRILHLFRRAIEFTRLSDDDFSGRELREAYCMLDGVPFSFMDSEELWEKPWEDRWGWLLNELGKTEEDIEKEEKEIAVSTNTLQKSLDDKDWDKKIDQEVKVRENHPLGDFDIEAYLELRVRGIIEESFASTLRLLGLDVEWTVEKTQKMMSRARHLADVSEEMRKNYPFPSLGAMNEFSRQLNALWSITPREELQGLSPTDMCMIYRVQ